MELNLQSLFGLRVYTVVLIGWDPATPSSPRIWAHMRGCYWSAKNARRHLFVISCLNYHVQNVATSLSFCQGFVDTKLRENWFCSKEADIEPRTLKSLIFLITRNLFLKIWEIRFWLVIISFNYFAQVSKGFKDDTPPPPPCLTGLDR